MRDNEYRDLSAEESDARAAAGETFRYPFEGR